MTPDAMPSTWSSSPAGAYLALLPWCGCGRLPNGSGRLAVAGHTALLDDRVATSRCLAHTRRTNEGQHMAARKSLKRRPTKPGTLTQKRKQSPVQPQENTEPQLIGIPRSRQAWRSRSPWRRGYRWWLEGGPRRPATRSRGGEHGAKPGQSNSRVVEGKWTEGRKPCAPARCGRATWAGLLQDGSSGSWTYLLHPSGKPRRLAACRSLGHIRHPPSRAEAAQPGGAPPVELTECARARGAVFPWCQPGYTLLLTVRGL